MAHNVSAGRTGPSESDIRDAARALRAGELVAMPTETVYGLACDATNPEAIRRVFEMKGRPPTNPLIVHVDGLAMARSCAAEWPALAEQLAQAFWPGPLTLVVPRGDRISHAITAGLDAVAVRMPAHPVALALIHAAGVPIAAPSANPYMAVSPTTADHVRKGLGHALNRILDAGPTQVGIESTVVDLTVSPPRVLRHGGVPIAALMPFIPDLVDNLAALSGQHLPSPGQARRHYAPDAPLSILSTCQLWDTWATLLNAGHTCAVIHHTEAPAHASGPMVVKLCADPIAYGRDLYATLHHLGALDPDYILVEAVPESSEWLAVRDRLDRASHAG